MSAIHSVDHSSGPWLDAIRWDEHGLVAVIAQEVSTYRVMMFAWMNRDTLAETARTGEAVYWSRSRGRRWKKGEDSGHVQRVREIRLDCDGDVIIVQIEQEGGIACHTGRASCFYQQLVDGHWVTVEPVIKDPNEIYKR